MPTVGKVVTILKDAGCPESRAIPAAPGKMAGNTPGFRVQTSTLEKRAVHVFHIGKKLRTSLDQYKALLTEAGLLVRHQHGGLRVKTRRSPADREE